MILLVSADEACQAEIQTEAEKIQESVLIQKEPLSLDWALENPRLVLVDLGAWDLDSVDFIEKTKQNPATKPIPLVAFGNSLRADLLQDAKEAGADLVLPKSAFRDQLPGILRHFAKNLKN